MNEQETHSGKDIVPPEVEGKNTSTDRTTSRPKATSRVKTYMEIYRISMEFLSKSVLPISLITVVLIFRSEIESLLNRATGADIFGLEFNFDQERFETVDNYRELLQQSIETGDTEAFESVLNSASREAADKVIRRFWQPDGRNSNTDNESVIRSWMDENGLEQESLEYFMRSESYADEREKATRNLALGR